jgi:(1->4)-alpha-D-glucan 1-alpha-D-glucosylmutase
MAAPLATYRLQLHAGFPLRRARQLVPYLRRLGITHLYCSPMLRARRGSTHGYDVVDPGMLDPALGSEAELRALVRTLRRHRMGVVLDVVPNHMAADADNPYWDDVLEQGRGSPYANWFDIDWEAAGPAGDERVFLPVLGDRLSRVLARGELRLVPDASGLRVRYYDQTFPLDPATLTERRRPGEPLRVTARRLSRGPALRELLGAQHYRLAYWRRAAREINYRRFFTVSHLVAVRVEDPAVFRASHAVIRRWMTEGLLDGLRIDHVDGLLDPLEYLERLVRLAGGRRPWLYVEKILARNESLPPRWPVSGTTGYEVLDDLEDVWLDPAGTAAIARLYRSFTGHAAPFHTVALQAKRRILDHHLAADLWRLTRLCSRALPPNRRRWGTRQLALAVREVIVHLSVYRTYIDDRHVISASDRRRLRHAIAAARRSGRAEPRIVDAVGALLLVPRDAARRPARLDFVRRFQQLCPPVAAKGVEDTALYRFVPLVSRNEVGADPGAPLIQPLTGLHRANRRRRRRWPAGLLPVSTHDTKRSADVRARLDALTELPQDWAAHVRRWRRLNAPLRGRLDGNTEYLFYQSLVGLWPLEVPSGRIPRGSAWATIRRRLEAHMRKAVREAKTHTSWVHPDGRYEAVVQRFVQAVLAPGNRAFLRDVAAFAGRVSRAGLWNATSRTLVQCTAPGVPDTYQGDELWNFCLVDPDNRRPVDYATRSRTLRDLERRLARGAGKRRALLDELVRRPEDGRIKLYTLWRALGARRRSPDLFSRGSYHGLRSTGPLARHLVAFARRDSRGTAITVVPRLTARLGADGAAPLGRIWKGTAVRLPFRLRSRTTEVLSGQRVAAKRDSRGSYLAVDELFHHLPVALLLDSG